MQSMRYIGPHESLKGKTALVQVVGLETCRAQFDDRRARLGKSLVGFHWHCFPLKDFEPNERTGDAPQCGEGIGATTCDPGRERLHAARHT